MLFGDFNIIPTERDVYKPERWLEDALFAPEARSRFTELMRQGWVDALRAIYPDETVYTFWHYYRNAFTRDAGIRIDHILLSPDLANRLDGAGVDRSARALEKASDHAPAPSIFTAPLGWIRIVWPPFAAVLAEMDRYGTVRRDYPVLAASDRLGYRIGEFRCRLVTFVGQLGDEGPFDAEGKGADRHINTIAYFFRADSAHQP